MDIDLAVLADAATVDGSGKLNILGIFDRISASNYPARHGRVAMVLRFTGGSNDAGKHQITIALKGPDGSEVVRLNGDLQVGAPSFSAGSGTIRVPHVLNLDGLVFEKSGTYAFDVAVDGEHQVSIPLHLVDGGSAGAQGGGSIAGSSGRPAQA